MRSIIAVCFVALGTLALSCKKDHAYQIVCKWRIIKDSSYAEGAPPIFNPGQGAAYTGTAADYYDFRADGTLYIKEGNYADTLTYSMPSGAEVNFIYRTFNNVVDSVGNIISRTHPTKSYSITALPANQLILVSKLTASILTPVGYFANTVTLER